MTDADAAAIKAYLFSLKPVHAPAPRNTLASRSISAHSWECGQCSSIRTGVSSRGRSAIRSGIAAPTSGSHGSLRRMPHAAQSDAGARSAGKIAGTVQSGWRAYNITSDRQQRSRRLERGGSRALPQPGSCGRTRHGDRSHGEAVDHSLRYLTQGDVTAWCAYLRSVSGIATSDLTLPRPFRPRPPMRRVGGRRRLARPGRLCRRLRGLPRLDRCQPVAPLCNAHRRPSVNDPTATNVVQVILSGAHRQNGDATTMPAFAVPTRMMKSRGWRTTSPRRFGAEPSAVTAKKHRRASCAGLKSPAAHSPSDDLNTTPSFITNCTDCSARSYPPPTATERTLSRALRLR